VGHAVNASSKDPQKQAEMPKLWELMDQIGQVVKAFKDQLTKVGMKQAPLPVFIQELLLFKDGKPPGSKKETPK
jgi:hypothetical protein